MIFDAYFNEKKHEVKIVEEGSGFLITIDNRPPFHIDVVDKDTGGYSFVFKGRPYEFNVEHKDTVYNVMLRGKLYSLELIDPKSVDIKSKERGEKKLMAYMPGKIIKIFVKLGDPVSKGQGLMIMEAMKMENELKAPCSGKVKSIRVREGQAVEVGEDLIFIE